MTRNSRLEAEVFLTSKPQPGLGMFKSGAHQATGLRASHADISGSHESPLPVFHPEFGRFMLEATPGQPWGIEFKELLAVEPDMKLRYALDLSMVVSHIHANRH